MNYLTWDDYIGLIQGNCVAQSVNNESLDYFFSQFKSEFDCPELGKVKIVNYSVRNDINLSYGRYSMPERCHIENIHEEDYIGFYFCLGGKVKLLDENFNKDSMNKGDVAYHKAKKGLTVIDVIPTEDDYELLMIHFSMDSFSNFLGKRVDNLPEFLQENSNEFDKPYRVKSMSHEFFTRLKNIDFDIKKEVESQLDLESKIYEFMSYAINAFSAMDKGVKTAIKKEQKLFESICKDIRNHMVDPISLSDLSKKYKIKESEIKNLFKKEFNTTPKKFLKEYRLLKAKELLVEGECDVNTAAYVVGYSSVSSFSRAFIEKFGSRPGHFMPTK